MTRSLRLARVLGSVILSVFLFLIGAVVGGIAERVFVVAGIAATGASMVVWAADWGQLIRFLVWGPWSPETTARWTGIAILVLAVRVSI